MARIVLINPKFEPSFWGLDYAMPLILYKALLPPLNLALLASLTPAEHSVTIIDENVETINYDLCEGADIVGVTGMVIQKHRMRQIMSELKRRGLFVAVGGPCVTVDPDSVEDLADVTFMGEAEETWPRFLEQWSEGNHARSYEQNDKTDVAKLPPPRLDLLKMRKYLFGNLQISRGCPFTCEFCDIIVVFGRRPRLKNAKQIIAELDDLLAAGKENVFIVDDNLIGNKKAIKPILREIIAWQKARGYPLCLTTEASIDLAEDDEMVRLMAEANFDTVFIGVESTNDDALRETKKIQNVTDRHGTQLEKVRHIQNSGIEVMCGMIVGFDSDDESVFANQERFIQESRIPLAMINILTAIPMTPLFDRLLREGRLDLRADTVTFSTVNTNIIPARMSRSTLCDGYLELMRVLYSPEAYFQRVDDLYLESGYRPNASMQDYMRRHPWRSLLKRTRYRLEIIGMFVQLQLLVSDKGLRREYRRRLWNAWWKSPDLLTLRYYCVKCLFHFHFTELVKKFARDRETVGPDLFSEPAALVVPQPSTELLPAAMEQATPRVA